MILEVVHIRTLVVLGRHRLGPAICWLRLRPTSWHERERTLVIECQRWTKPPESTSLLLAEVVAASTAKLVAQLVCWIGSSVRGATQFGCQWQIAAHLLKFAGLGSPMSGNCVSGTEKRLRAPCQDAMESICRSDLAREGFGSSQSISGEDS
jgi:hypothetical protein